MIKKTCKTCEHRFGLSWHEPLPDPCRKCPSPEHPQHRLDRGLLEARVAELEAERASAIARAAEERSARCGLEEQLAEAELDAVDDVVERDGGPSRGEVIRQCVRQVLLPDRAAAEGALSGALAASEVAAEVERRTKR